MDRVSTSFQHQSVLADLMRAQGRQLEAQRQVSTGKIGDDLKAYADRARTVTATKTVQNRVDGLVDQLGQLRVRLNVQQTAMETVVESGANLKQALTQALANDRADALMAQVKAEFMRAAEALNARFGEDYVFGGGEVNAKPFAGTSLEDLAAAASAADLFRNGPLAAVNRIDDTATYKTGFLADDLGQALMESFRRIQTFSAGPDGPLEGQLTTAQRAFLEAEIAQLSNVNADVIRKAAEGGAVQKRVDEAFATQSDRQVALKSVMADLTEVDMAEAVSRLTQAQTAVQASAQVFLSLKDMSLLNLLK